MSLHGVGAGVGVGVGATKTGVYVGAGSGVGVGVGVTVAGGSGAMQPENRESITTITAMVAMSILFMVSPFVLHSS